MIEYLYNAIRATAGNDISISARVKDAGGVAVIDNCHLMLFDDEELLITVDGIFTGDVWEYTIPADATRGLSGRYWYCICDNSGSLCFKEPIYLV